MYQTSTSMHILKAKMMQQDLQMCEIPRRKLLEVSEILKLCDTNSPTEANTPAAAISGQSKTTKHLYLLLWESKSPSSRDKQTIFRSLNKFVKLGDDEIEKDDVRLWLN